MGFLTIFGQPKYGFWCHNLSPTMLVAVQFATLKSVNAQIDITCVFHFEVIFIDQRSFNSMSREVPIKDGTIEPNESGMLPEGGMTIPQMRAFIQKQVNCNLA